MHALTSLIALAIEASFGYPQWIYRHVGHPVSWIGKLIAWCEERWNGPRLSFAERRINGACALGLVLAITAATCLAFVWTADALLPASLALLVIGAAASTLIAQRSLDEHVAAVADALERDGLPAARRAVAMIVGRDTETLDTAAVSRAAIESLAENYSDGVVAPLFWLLVGGLPAAALYKSVNTADSMIGHRSDRYLAFGWAAARLDDLVNLPASRLAALTLIAAAAVRSDFSGSEALQAVTRDARRHRSPNAGWPEAAMAGALGVALAGPRSYRGHVTDDGWMGSGRAGLTADDIRRALSLYRTACVVQGIIVAAAGLAMVAVL